MANGSIVVDPQDVDQARATAVPGSAGTITVDPRDLDQPQTLAARNSARSITVDPSEVEAAPAPNATPDKTYSLSDLATPGRSEPSVGLPSQFEEPYTVAPGPFGEPELTEASKQRIAREQLEQGAHIGPGKPGAGGWLENLEADIRHGTGATAPGRALQALGAPGTESGVAPGVAETIGGPFVGPVRVVRGLKQALGPYAGESADVGSEVEGLNEALRGGMQTAAPVIAATNPEFIPTMVPYAVGGALAEAALRKAGVPPEEAELASNVALLGGGAAAGMGEARPEFEGTTFDRSRAATEPVIQGETVPDYLAGVTNKTAAAVENARRLERINAPVEIPRTPETTAPPPILSRPTPRTPMEELSSQAAEARAPQEFRQQLTNEIADQIISRLRDEGLLEPPQTNITDRRVVRPEDIEPYEPPRHFIGGENIPASVVPSAARVEQMLRATPANEPVTVGAGETLAPESAATLKAQTDALADGTAKAVYFPKGTETLPAPPENATVTVVKGDKPGAGTYYHDSSITPQQVRAAVKNGSYHELLGHVQTKEEATGHGTSPVAVVARDQAGNELKASVVDSSRPDLIRAQADILAKQFPSATITAEHPQRVISERRRMLPPAPPEAIEAAEQAHQQFEQELTETRGRVPLKPRQPEPIAAPTDITADSRRVGNLFAGRMGNPIERQFTMDLWHWMLDRKGSEPEPPPNVGKQRAAIIRDRLAEISRGQIAGRVPDPKTVFAPDVLEEAHAMMAHTHDFLSQQERPGRYFADMGEETSLTGRGPKVPITAVTSLRGQFPWFANLKESPSDLAKALKRGEGPTYDKLLTSAAEHITRTRQEFTRMARSVEPNLDGLADEVRDLDPDLAAFLTDAAQGKISTWTETKQDQLAKIEERISNARQAIEFGRAVDDLSGEERAGSLPEAHEGREETAPLGRPSGAGTRPSEAATQHPVTPNSEEILPGLEGAVAEQNRAAGVEQGRRLGEEAARPLGNIEERAGTMERESPLFRGTEASPQSEMFDQSRPRFASRSREELSAATSTAADQAQALRTENLRLEEQLRNRPDAPAEERRDAQERIEQNRQMISALERSKGGEAGFATLDLIRDVLSGRLPKEAWQRFVAQPFIEKGLGIGDKYAKVREADPDVAAGLHLLDNAPSYFRNKAAQTVHDIIGGLSREQERLFSLMADADSRENLRTNHPQEFRQATNDPAIQEALRKYRPIEKQLTAARERMGGATLDRDYLRRVYDQHVAGIGQAEAPGTSERATTAFDRVIQPQRLGNMTREATAEYHYQHGLHEFGPAFGTKFLATNLRALEDQVARDFISKATELKPGDPEPRFITYRGEKYYRPDIARDMRDAGEKNVKVYDRYDPTAGVKYPQQGTSRFLGPREVVRALNDYSAGQGEGPGAVRRFLQEQVIGYGFGIPHVANILRRVTQSAPMGAANPEAWVRAWKVAFGKELRERGIQGIDDPTFDRLMRHGAITGGEMANLKRYWGGNLNPANWARALARVGHKLIFEPGSFGGFGGVDQRARIYIADLVKSQNPGLSDEQIARAVNTQLGDYNRANWTNRQKIMAKFMLFPGWDSSSIRWVIEHPIKTTVPPALLVWTANQILNRYGQNQTEEANDIQNIHWGDRSIGITLLRESMARNLERPLLNYAQSRIRGESNQRALGEAARGVKQGAGGLVGTLRPDITGVIDLAMNRESPFGGRELVSSRDYNLPGRVLPNRALEKQAVLVVRHAIPALDRMIGSDRNVDFAAFAGSNIGLPNYKYGAEQRLGRNTAESMEVSQTLSRLAKTDQAMARQFIKDPDNAAYALFRNEFSEMSKVLKRMDGAKEAVTSAKNVSAAEKKQRLAQIDHARQNLLRNADGLDRLLFERKQENRGRIPTSAPASPLLGVPRESVVPVQPPG